MEKGVPIRSISRSISILQAVNRHGSLTLMQISKEARVPYPTACRIVQTLMVEGLIERENDRKRYRPTALVHTLSHGFQGDERLVQIARRHIVALTNKISWPVAVTTRVGQRMMVRDSTHALTSLTFTNYQSGYTLPLLECATGRCYLAFCSAEERQNVLDGIEAVHDGTPASRDALTLFKSGFMVNEIKGQGYATRGRNPYTETPGKTSSIAVPIFEGDQVVASLAVAFFAVAMDMEKAVETFVPLAKRTASDISSELSNASTRPASRAPQAEKLMHAH